MNRTHTGLIALIAAAVGLIAPAGASAGVLVSSTGDTIEVIAHPGPESNGIVFNWDLDQAGYISFFSPVPDPGSQRTGPDQLTVAGACTLATTGSGAPEVRCPLGGVSHLRASMDAGDDDFSGAVTRGDELIPDVLFPVPVRVTGGSGDDFLQGAGRGSEVFGGAGDDQMIGRRGGSTMRGGAGNDRLAAEGDSSDRLFGGGGGDVLDGAGGDDFLNGQEGRDLLRAGGGGDIVDSRDGIRDKLVSCGGGTGDLGRPDRWDRRVRGCERLLKAAP
jgi:Ca2+-binding RTX toxin-like protein